MIINSNFFLKSILIFSLLTTISSCKKTGEKKSKVVYNDPHKYYTVIEKNNNNVKNLFLEINSKKTSDDCRKLISTLKENIIKSLNIYYSIKLNVDDYGLKDTYLNQMRFYEKQGLKYIVQIVDIKQELEILAENDLEFSKSLNEEYKKIKEILYLKELEGSEDIEKVKRNFFKKYNIAE
tara:strand:+ start:1280 stop:1819 length:540 start_codon:yes stop_codon:yes gene_type:complete